MNKEGLNVSATARVKLTKLDENGKVVETIEKEIDLTREEVQVLWQSQMQE